MTSRNWRNWDCRRRGGMRRSRRLLRMQCICLRISLRGWETGRIRSSRISLRSTRRARQRPCIWAGRAISFTRWTILIYAYLQSGREADAQKVIDKVKTMPDMEMGGARDMKPFAMSKFPAMYAMELHRWTEAAALPVVRTPRRGIAHIPIGRGRSETRAAGIRRRRKKIWPRLTPSEGESEAQTRLRLRLSRDALRRSERLGAPRRWKK